MIFWNQKKFGLFVNVFFILIITRNQHFTPTNFVNNECYTMISIIIIYFPFWFF